jgi:hypothetical protein
MLINNKIQSGDTGLVKIKVDIALINSLSYSLYEVDSNFIPLTGTDIKTSSNLQVDISDSYLSCRFCPSEITNLVQFYGVIICLNDQNTASTSQREYSIIFEITDYMK